MKKQLRGTYKTVIILPVTGSQSSLSYFRRPPLIAYKMNYHPPIVPLQRSDPRSHYLLALASRSRDRLDNMYDKPVVLFAWINSLLLSEISLLSMRDVIQ